MAELDPVLQAFVADTARYVDAIASATATVKEFAAANHEAIASVAELQAALDGLHGHDVSIGVDAGAAAAAGAAEDLSRAAADAAHSEYEEAAASHVAAGASQDAAAAAVIQAGATRAAGDAANTSIRHYSLFGTVLSALTAKVPLFGGALEKIPLMGEAAGWHLLADAVVETTAVWVPAAIAFGAFTAAALPTLQDIGSQMKNLYTVSQATGQAIPGLTGNFSRLSEAVRPEVYDLFGEALQTITHNGGAFSTMAEGAGQVLDALGARMEVAITDGHGMNDFATTAVSDLGKLTNSIGNVVGIFGDFLKVVPGYAGILLNLGDTATHLAENFTTVAEPVLKAGLALHGAVIYGGLAATALAKVMSGGLGMLSSWAEKAAYAASGSELLGSAGEKAGAGLLSVASGAETAAALPWGWIAIAAAGYGFLAYEALQAKDATAQYLAAQQAALATAPAVKGYSMLQADQADVAYRLTQAQQGVSQALQHVAFTGDAAGKDMSGLSSNVEEAQGKFRELAAGQKVLSDQTTLYQGRLGKLAAQYGGVGEAEGLLTASGIKMGQMLDKNAGEWQQIQAQLGGLVSAYREMGQQAGTLGSDMNALTIAGSDQVSAMSNLNKAWDNTIGITSGGQNAFISFEQSLSTSAAGSAKLDSSIGSLSIAMKASGASMTGLNSPSLALRSAWQGAYGAGEQLTDALRMMSSVSPGGFPSMTKAMKDTIAELMPLGKQSGATRAELVEMAQEIDPNIHNFQQLTHWLGNTKNAGQDLNKILTQAGTNLEDLAADASKLSDAMQSDVTAQMAQAKLEANHTDQAITNLAQAMNTAGTTASARHSDMVKLYDDLRQDGYGAQQAQAMIESMTGSIFRIPHSAHTQFSNNASAAQAAIDNYLRYLEHIPASVTTDVITNYVSTGYSGPGGVGHHVGAHGGMVTAMGIIPSFAGGGMLPGFAPGLDIIPALLSPGESVLTPATTRLLGGRSAIDWLNTVGEHGGAGGGAVSAPSGGGRGGAVIHGDIVIQVDGQQLMKLTQQQLLKYNTRNSGKRTGRMVPS